MRRHDLTDISDNEIEDRTALRIRQYEQRVGHSVTLPVPVENIVEQILDLDFDWIDIQEQRGEMILAGLVPEDRRIVLNTRHMELFEEKPGLERSTIGHEAGHWDIDIDRTSLHHPCLPGMEPDNTVVLKYSADERILAEVLNRAVYDPRYFDLYRHLTAGQDSPEVRSAVERYQSALLMPDWLLRDAIRDIDVTHWPALYDLAAAAQVTISNLVVRLVRMNVIYIPDGTHDLYAGIDSFTGQQHLF